MDELPLVQCNSHMIDLAAIDSKEDKIAPLDIRSVHRCAVAEHIGRDPR